MKTLKSGLVTIFVVVVSLASLNAAGFGTAFSYQGRLNLGTNPANGRFDLKFALFDSVVGGGQTGVAVTNTSVAVTNGIFTQILDFGPGVFDGSARWLEISVKTNGIATFTTLSPRQEIGPTPYAITASNVSGTVSGSQLSGTIGSANLPSNPGFSGTVTANGFSGNGAGLSAVNASSLNGLNSAAFWKLSGNSATIPGTNFLGTTDANALEIKVNNQRALRLEPSSSGLPNFIGGASGNTVATGLYGAAIGGGDQNHITGNGLASVIAGGRSNLVLDTNSVIAGGVGNVVGDTVSQLPGSYGFIGGGYLNSVSNQYASIAGGIGNVAGYPGAFVGGGSNNYAGADYAAIAGGVNNGIGMGRFPFGVFSTIGGGSNNIIGVYQMDGSTGGTIAGGMNNLIGSSFHCTIGGGLNNKCVSAEELSNATIAGGINNTVSGSGSSGTIGGGYGNHLGGDASVIAGGRNNTTTLLGSLAIGGGNDNYASGIGGTIGGGQTNFLTGDASVIGGGRNNTSTSAGLSTIAGGNSNQVTGVGGTIGGGESNSVSAAYGSTPGGLQAVARNYGQVAHASGSFTNAGDAQTSVYVCRVLTTNGTPTELFLDGIAQRMIIPTNSAWTFDALITARSLLGNTAGYQIQGVIKNTGGAMFFAGTPKVTIIAEDVSAWDATAAVDNANHALVLRVAGVNGTTIRWVASVRTAEVTF